MKYFVLLLLLNLAILRVDAQVSWEFEDSDESMSFEHADSFLELENGDIVYVSFGQRTGESRFTLIETLNKNGISKNKIVLYSDSLEYYFLQVVNVEEGYLVMGTTWDVSDKISYFTTWLFDDSLELVSFNRYKVDDQMFIYQTLLTDEDEVIVVIPTREWISHRYKQYYLVKVDNQGILLDSIKVPTIAAGQQIKTIEKQHGGNGYIAMDFLGNYFELDSDFNLIKKGATEITPWLGIETGCLKRFSDSTYIYNATIMIDNDPDFHRIETILLDTLMEVIKSYSYDDYAVSISSYNNSIDWVDVSNVYIGGYSSNVGGYVYENLVLIKLDENLEEQWVMHYGGQVSYTVHSVKATMDGGCIVSSGKRRNFTQFPPYYKYIIKVGPDGVLNTADRLKDDNMWSITYFPNPSAGQLTLRVSGLINNARLEVNNTVGQRVKGFDNITQGENHFDLSSLTSGLYHLVLYKDNKIIGTHKWVKEL